MRINKYLALNKYSTRRGADELIKSGKVTINGVKAKLGDKVSEGDKIVVDSKTIAALQEQYVYYAYNKPIGVVTENIKELIKEPVFPVGRLDEASHGLIILTNDGRVTDRLLNPDYDHEKEYAVRVNKPIQENFLTRMTKGVKIEDGITKPAVVDGDAFSKSFHITLTEGKKHQIRRMVTALGYEVVDLERVRVMNVKLGYLKSGQFRRLAGAELAGFLSDIGLS